MSNVVQIVTTPGGEDLAIMPRAEYEALLEAAENAADAALLAARSDEPSLPLEDTMAIISGDLHPLVAWRKQKGLSQAELAKQANLRKATISDIERGAAPNVAAATMKKIADALGLAIDDLFA